MDKISDSVKSVQDESAGFFNYVFNFDTENKHRMMNMIQYTLLTIIPVLLILRGIKHIIPEDDDSKGSLEILAESVGQVILIMMAIWFTTKIIYYIPTYSGEEYLKPNDTSFIIPFILILATMQTKLGAKFNILIDRAMLMISGKSGEAAAQQQGKNVVRVSQPLGGPSYPALNVIHQPSAADYLDRNQILPGGGGGGQLTGLPTKYAGERQGGGVGGGQVQEQVQGGMYQQLEPAAANDGSGGWGSAW